MITPARLGNHVFAAIRRAFGKFLALPIAVVLGFVLLNIATYFADDAWSHGHIPHGLGWLGDFLGDKQAMNGLLTTVASSIITVTSITFSLLLIAIQQGASSLTTQVIDQFLMRKVNQFYFGFFVGLSIFVLIMLVTDSSVHRPVFGTVLSLVLTMVALCMIVVMIYNTIEQMRPAQIVLAIHGHILKAREHETGLLAKTRRQPHDDWPVVLTVRSPAAQYLCAINVPCLIDAIAKHVPSQAGLEVEVAVPIGAALAFGDPLLRIRQDRGVSRDRQGLDAAALEDLETAMLAALAFDDGRDLKHDTGYGLYQLSIIAWTAVSTAKSNPSPGLDVIRSLRDIISRWGQSEAAAPEDPHSAVVYADLSPSAATDALETIIVASSESMQAQTLSGALCTIVTLLDRVDDVTAGRLADIVHRSLSALGEHVLTRELDATLGRLSTALHQRGFPLVGDELAAATATFGRSLGRLNSRSTRVPGPG